MIPNSINCNQPNQTALITRTQTKEKT